MSVEPAAESVPLPPGVPGYAVALAGPRPQLTHSTVMDRDTAEAEAREWRRKALGGSRYVVCEIREAS